MIEEFFIKAKAIVQCVLQNINQLIYRLSKRRYILVNQQLNDPIARQVVGAHVVTNSIHLRIFPFLYGIANLFITSLIEANIINYA